MTSLNTFIELGVGLGLGDDDLLEHLHRVRGGVGARVTMTSLNTFIELGVGLGLGDDDLLEHLHRVRGGVRARGR